MYSGFSDPKSYTAFADYSMSHVLVSNMQNNAFLNNFITAFTTTILYYLYIIVMGLSFSVMAMLAFVANAVSTGFMFNQTINNVNLLVPQSILTLIASVFAMCGAFLVTKMEVRFIAYLFNSKKNPLSRLKAPFKDVILSITLMLIFVVIASTLSALL